MEALSSFVKIHQRKIILSFAVAAIIILRLMPISFGDLYGDSAINSFRAYGWLDYFGTTGQTTPLQWFGNIPAWAELSFHDAPPLAFFAQRIFFAVLGGSAAAARLPFVLAGIASIWLVYYFLKRLANETAASVAVIAYAVSSYAAWAGQAAYLEGIEELFIVGSVLFGAYFLFKKTDGKLIYAWAALTACALLTKYTALFLIPPILVYIFLYRQEFKKQWKRLILAVILFILLLSPAIIYNLNLYESRGHFDAALSSIVGMHSDDFSIIDNRSAHYDIFGNTVGVFRNLADNMSYPFLFLAVSFLVFMAIRTRKTGMRSFETLILINVAFLLLLLGFIGGATRFSSIIVPFFAIGIGLGARGLLEIAKNKKARIACAAGIVGVFLFEFAYSLNTNVLKNPVSMSDWLYSKNKIENLGFNQLDDFIRSKIITELPPRNIIKTKNDLIFNSDDVKGRSAVIFDDRIIWNAQMWYFQRYFLYYRWPIISTAFLSALDEHKISIPDLMAVSGKPLYFIYPINPAVIDPVRAADNAINKVGPELAKRFDEQAASTTIVYNSLGVPAFKVYWIDRLNP